MNHLIKASDNLIRISIMMFDFNTLEWMILSLSSSVKTSQATFNTLCLAFIRSSTNFLFLFPSFSLSPKFHWAHLACQHFSLYTDHNHHRFRSLYFHTNREGDRKIILSIKIHHHWPKFSCSFHPHASFSSLFHQNFSLNTQIQLCRYQFVFNSLSSLFPFAKLFKWNAWLVDSNRIESLLHTVWIS